MQRALLLHNIRSVYNVGSIFRTADAAGVSNIILCGYTPAPTDRFGRVRKDFIKVSLGAEKMLRWQHITNPYAAIKSLRLDGFTIVALEQDKNSVSIFEYKKIPDKLALVLGNEVRGLTKALLAKCDAVVEIPMRRAMVRHAHHPRNSKRGKESLNVSVAAGVALFTLAR